MRRIDNILSWTAFALATGVVLLGPWLYGSWEMWWFWPMTTLLFLSTACFALRLVITAGESSIMEINRRKQAGFLVLSFIPFLLYALIRWIMSDVYMDAERSFLLHFLPFLLGIQIIGGFSETQRKALYMLILIDLLCLGAYGLSNHFITHNTYVLFFKGYSQYFVDNRATGTYFCPDHFSGIMELAFCLGSAILITRKVEWQPKLFAGVLVLIALAGVILSKSRGGGMAIIVVCLSALIWGLSQRRKMIRWYYRFFSIAFITLSILLFFATDTPYTLRFKSYFISPEMRGKPLEEKSHAIAVKLRLTARGHMYTGAIRAWKTAPWLGIGPGMHQNLWPHFDNSQDGDRETGKWPTYQYTAQVSYEVHSDWIQLLEEYGIIGVLLFCFPAYVTFSLLLKSRKCEHAVGLGAVLAFVCMTFHSFGDFNLQMPATTWMLASIIAIPLSIYLRYPVESGGANE